MKLPDELNSQWFCLLVQPNAAENKTAPKKLTDVSFEALISNLNWSLMTSQASHKEAKDTESVERVFSYCKVLHFNTGV